MTEEAIYDESDLEPLGGNILAMLAGKAEDLLRAQAAVTAAELALETAKKALDEIQLHGLPDLMLEARQTKCTAIAADGTALEIEIEDQLQANIAKSRKAVAHQWLIDNGQGGVIKREVTITIAKGDKGVAEYDAIKAAAIDAGRTNGDVTIDETVHAATLKKLMRELKVKGVEVPAEPFGLFNRKVAHVTRSGK